MRIGINWCWIIASIVLMGAGLAEAAQGQAEPRQSLLNGDLEESDANELPRDWTFHSTCGGILSLDSQAPFRGKRLAVIDSTKPTAGSQQLFSNLMQNVDAQSWQGQKVRFHAAVKTAELGPNSTVQLWFRVDRKPNAQGQTQTGAFDNMQNRPIRANEWTRQEIILVVDEDAVNLACGIFITGTGIARVDDLVIEIADPAAVTTEMKIPAASASARPAMDPLVMKAWETAESAPHQPFFNHWLWLPAIALLLFAIAFWPTKAHIEANLNSSIPPTRIRGLAIRFTVAYWLLYSLPSPFSDLIPWLGPQLSVCRGWLENHLVAAVARVVFKIDGELVPPNGSGDTTFNYLAVLSTFVLAALIAVVWSLISRRNTDYPLARDLLRSYLRYVLAFTLLGYGLAKVTLEFNQFPLVSDWQLKKTWGDSSPMNVLWAFMGTSRPYTIFAGLSEVLGAMLLVWRRTSTLGALVAIGVMTNVVLLNFCFDVPVKLYSSHLLTMAILIALPDARRLANLLFWNRSTPSVDLIEMWRGVWAGRFRWAVKTMMIVVGLALPLGTQIWNITNQLQKSETAQSQENKPVESKYRLTNRGYRWINEVPFNR